VLEERPGIAQLVKAPTTALLVQERDQPLADGPSVWCLLSLEADPMMLVPIVFGERAFPFVHEEHFPHSE
jgi:hypothetical protein